MAHTPSQQIQVIPQHLSSAQLQQLYMPQQHIILPSNVTLQQGGTLSSSQGVSLQLQPKPVDSKPMGLQTIQPYQNAVILQPKPSYSTVQNHILSSHVKQHRHSVTSQAPGTLYSHPQLLGSYALSPLPPGYTWASSPAAFPTSQSPILISREQPNVYVQSQSHSLQVPVVSGQYLAPTSYSHVPNTVQSIATQTSAPSSLNSGTLSYLPQEQNVETTATVVNSASSEKLTQPSSAILPPSNIQPPTEVSETVASVQTETALTETFPPMPELKPVKVESQCSPMPVAEATEVSPSALPADSGNLCASVMPVEACSPPASAECSATLEQQPASSTEELSSDLIPHCSGGNEIESQPVPEKPKKPVADVKPVPDQADSSTNVPENTDNSKHSAKMTNEQKMARFNPVIKLKRLKPQDSMLTPYSRVVKDKQPQKAIVKPQMLSQVIDSYVIQEVTLKSVVDSSSTDISENSNSDDKSEVSVPGVSSSSMESSAEILRDTLPERKELLPVFRVGRGRGRPRGRGRQPKKSKTPTFVRRSLRQKIAGPVSYIDKDDADISEENSSRAADSSIIYQTDNENFPPHDATESDLSFDISTLAAVSSEIGKSVVDIHKKPPDVWSVQEVFEFVRDFPGCLEFAETFKAQEIDGQALLLMNLDHLMTGMHMKLGPALKLIAHISSMKEQGHHKVFEAVGGRIGVRSSDSHTPRRRRGRPRKRLSSSRQEDSHATGSIGSDRNATESLENHLISDVFQEKSLQESSGSPPCQLGDERFRRRPGRPRKNQVQPVFVDLTDEGDCDVHQSSETAEASLFCDISNFQARRRTRSLSRSRV